MRIITKGTLLVFITKYPEASKGIVAWFQFCKRADWNKPNDVKEFDPKVSIIGNSRAVFNIHGNKFRLIVKIDYKFKAIYIKFFGTHSEYDAVDAETVDISP